MSLVRLPRIAYDKGDHIRSNGTREDKKLGDQWTKVGVDLDNVSGRIIAKLGY